MEIGAAAHEQRYGLRDWLQHFTACLARRELRVFGKLGNLREKIDIDLTLDALLEQIGFIGIFLAPIVVSFFPTLVIRQQFLFVLGKVIAGLF